MTTAEQAVKHALSRVGTGEYQLGTGDCYTERGGKSDCAGFAINWCYNLRRHRPGFNRGPWSTVEDDINCNSAIEDADHHQELFTQAIPPDRPQEGEARPGDLLTYPTFVVGPKHIKFIGHVAIVVDVPADWRVGDPWARLTVVQCCGPNGRTPAILKTSGAHWDAHDQVWPKPQHRSRLLRVKQ